MSAAATAFGELMAQHDALRELIDHCEDLADDLDADRISPGEVLSEVARLRLAFDHHNRTEEPALRPILSEAGAFGDVRIDRMVADHIVEHRAMGDRLGSGLTAELRATLAMLRDHLVTEERYFASAGTVRDDH